MKHVYNNIELFHLAVHHWNDEDWAGREIQQRNARNSTGYVGFRAVSADETLVYSYQRPLARLLHNNRVAVIASRAGSLPQFAALSRRWSRDPGERTYWDLTEAEKRLVDCHSFYRHQWEINDALPQDWVKLRLDDISQDFERDTMFEKAQANIDALLERVLRLTSDAEQYARGERSFAPTSPQVYQDKINEAVRDWAVVAERMAWQVGVLAVEIDDETRQRIEAAIADRAEAEAKQRARWKRDRIRQYKEIKRNVADWYNGKGNHFPYLFNALGGKTLLRLEKHPKHGDVFRTSHGAFFPISHALVAYKAIERSIRRGEGFTAGNKAIPMGSYRLTQITNGGSDRARDWRAVAGCHTLFWPQIKAAHRQLVKAGLV